MILDYLDPRGNRLRTVRVFVCPHSRCCCHVFWYSVDVCNQVNCGSSTTVLLDKRLSEYFSACVQRSNGKCTQDNLHNLSGRLDGCPLFGRDCCLLLGRDCLLSSVWTWHYTELVCCLLSGRDATLNWVWNPRMRWLRWSGSSSLRNFLTWPLKTSYVGSVISGHTVSMTYKSNSHFTTFTCTQCVLHLTHTIEWYHVHRT